MRPEKQEEEKSKKQQRIRDEKKALHTISLKIRLTANRRSKKCVVYKYLEWPKDEFTEKNEKLQEPLGV